MTKQQRAALLSQLPEMEIVPMQDIPPFEEEDMYYEHPYDEVISLKKDEYTEKQALQRFAALCHIRGVVPVEFPFYTARFWCLRVIKA